MELSRMLHTVLSWEGWEGIGALALILTAVVATHPIRAQARRRRDLARTLRPRICAHAVGSRDRFDELIKAGHKGEATREELDRIVDFLQASIADSWALNSREAEALTVATLRLVSLKADRRLARTRCRDARETLQALVRAIHTHEIAKREDALKLESRVPKARE